MAKEKKGNNHLMSLLLFAIILFFISYMIVFFVGRNNSKKNHDKKEENTKVEIKDYESQIFTIRDGINYDPHVYSINDNKIILWVSEAVYLDTAGDKNDDIALDISDGDKVEEPFTT